MPMAHDWEDILCELTPAEQLSVYGHRRCRNCRAVQSREAQHVWMRITGYRWEPLVGGCPTALAPDEESVADKFATAGVDICCGTIEGE